MKTVYEIVKECKNRNGKTIYEILVEHRAKQGVQPSSPENPDYLEVGFQDGRTYHNVSNLVRGYWNEFDSVWEGVKSHIKTRATPGRFVEFVEKAPLNNEMVGKCKVVKIYTHSGIRRVFDDLTNLSEDKKGRIVEFNYVHYNVPVHVKMQGVVEMYEEVIEG